MIVLVGVERDGVFFFVGGGEERESLARKWFARRVGLLPSSLSDGPGMSPLVTWHRSDPSVVLASSRRVSITRVG